MTFKIFYSSNWDSRFFLNILIDDLTEYVKDNLPWGWEIAIHSPWLGSQVLHASTPSPEYLEGWQSEWSSEQEEIEGEPDYKRYNQDSFKADMGNIGTSDMFIGFWPSDTKTMCELTYALATRIPIIYCIDKSRVPYSNGFSHVDTASPFLPNVYLKEWREDNRKQTVLSNNRWYVKTFESLKHAVETELLKRSGIDIDLRTYGIEQDDIPPGGMPWSNPEEDDLLDVPELF